MKNQKTTSAGQISPTSKVKSSFRFLKKSILLLLLVPAVVWQCRKDDFKDEVVGICPEVVSTSPYNEETNVSTSKIITAKFNEKMDASTLNGTTFIVNDGVNQISGVVSYSDADSTASFIPAVFLLINTEYTATITMEARNPLGSALRADYVWTFTTGTSSSPGPGVDPQTDVDLGTSGNFAVISGSGITNTGPTIITGDMGTSPSGTISGFPPGIVAGNTHAADPVADQAKLDLTTAYNDAQGRSLGAGSLPGDLSGLTLTPGLYKNSSSVMLSAGAVTLDAQGDGNAVFIFQMGSSFTTNSGTTVILIGNANPANIYWSVGSSATLGTNSSFQGNILADQSISLSTGAALTGRALTRIGAVTLDDNAVTLP